MVGIKDFEMPYNCYDCELHNYHECNLTSESIEDDYCWNGDSREKHCPLVDAISKDQYENRLKADMVAMLTEIQMEIEEKFNDRPFSYNHHQRTKFYRDIDEIIQQKINELKE